MSKNIVHIIGTGTIGEPLTGLLADFKEAFGIDEVTFNKNTPHLRDRPKLNQLMKRGALMSAQEDKVAEFEAIGNKVHFTSEEAIARASVVIDCTPSGVGIDNKNQYYEKYKSSVKGFIAQGSEFGFGKMYAFGINDAALQQGEDQFIQVVSCNTHNLSVLLSAIGDDGSGSGPKISDGKFVMFRRANDISMDGSFVPAPQVGKHSDTEFGTHHARDAHHLFKTLGQDIKLYSSAIKLNTQYMHGVHFSIKVPFKTNMTDVMNRFEENPLIAMTEKMSANKVFSFGREHGHYGRILSQTVISRPAVTVRDEQEVIGFAFTPQDGNSLLSSVAATLWYLDPQSYRERLKALNPYLFQEV